MQLPPLFRGSFFAVVLYFVTLPLVMANTVIISSENFSLGYGFSHDGESSWWNTLETAGVNTPTTQGDFSFTPSVSGASYSSIGVDFPDRVLANRASSATGHTGTSASFGVSIAATWSGALPGDAELDPNYQIRLVITQISIYGAGITSQTTTDLAFVETTVGNTGTSPAIDVNLLQNSPPTEFNTASNWVQLSWNPDDFWTDGTTSTRTFAMTATENRGLDGFEVFGYVELSYAAIPEPGLVGVLFGVAAAGVLLARGRRRR